MKKNIVLMTVFMLFLSSCTYHLRYTISSERRKKEGGQLSDESPFEKTYAVESSGESDTDHELSRALAQSLELDGWSRLPKEDARYIFTVSFETEKKKEFDEFWLMRVFGRSGSFLFGNAAPRRRAYLYHYLEIEAYDGNRSYTWKSNIETGPVLQDIEALAVHIMPKAISLFPEEGYWEIEEEVYLHVE